MRQIYYDSQKETIISGHSLKVYSKRVPPGYILSVRACFVCSYEREANDGLRILLHDGAEEHTIRSWEPAITQTGLSVILGIAIGGNDRLIGYFPDADENDVIELHVFGVLVPAKEWQEGTE